MRASHVLTGRCQMINPDLCLERKERRAHAIILHLKDGYIRLISFEAMHVLEKVILTTERVYNNY